MSNQNGWIAIDLDATAAYYDGWKNGEIGEPIPLMVLRMHRWRVQGIRMKIFTARASDPDQIVAIQAWLKKHGLDICTMEVTNQKDFEMIQLWDDRAIQIIPNTGERADGVKDI